ncbi:TetR/AcrR family transcriptional regulator [Kribbella sandramycini]|uniref:AcrR family transcriptional regulator n=1 Tax=Kribbella sandramycini TaxID=60450 RepID=A0A7Y4P0Z9_9ACTN|nr:TetR/AcrR family transcriptional regulator [Kribbella sandramycini]MBB6565315.1 AcrR family transcriptional regulator [Kribbella sandramycini]NOL41584.1 TetR/AcrR family transcriptional regulator [Kribbella sandramycini]
MREPSVRRYSGRSVEEWKAARRERLLAAALELFGTEGYPATSVERLCTQAKVSTRHFYHEFQNKEAVLLAVHAEVIELTVRNTGDAIRDSVGEPVRERVTAAVDSYLRSIMADLRRARISFVEVVGTSPAVEEQRIAFRDLLIGFVRDLGDTAAARGEIAARDFRFVGLSFFGAVNAVVHDWMLTEPRPPEQKVQKSLRELAVQLITS